METERRITHANYLPDRNIIRVYYKTSVASAPHTTETTTPIEITITPFPNMTKDTLLARIRDKVNNNEDAHIVEIAGSIAGERF
ncbi:MAG: hypothetical protein ABIH76_06220 [Candidatus Bathyarchaeota archaeon]